MKQASPSYKKDKKCPLKFGLNTACFLGTVFHDFISQTISKFEEKLYGLYESKIVILKQILLFCDLKKAGRKTKYFLFENES